MHVCVMHVCVMHVCVVHVCACVLPSRSRCYACVSCVCWVGGLGWEGGIYVFIYVCIHFVYTCNYVYMHKMYVDICVSHTCVSHIRVSQAYVSHTCVSHTCVSHICVSHICVSHM